MKRLAKKIFSAIRNSRKARHGLTALGFLALAVATVILLNIITAKLVDRFPDLKADFTANKAYALSSDTVEYISHLDKDVKLYINSDEKTFLSGGSYFVQAKNLLDKMQSRSNGKFTYDFVNLTENPNFTRKYPNIDWTTRSTVAVIESGDQYKGLELEDCFTYDEKYYQAYQQYMWTGTTIEQAVVKGSVYVTDENKVLVNVMTGEGEDGYDALVSLLNDNAYETEEVSLVTDAINEKAQIVLLYAPQTDLNEKSAQALGEWLENGGKYGKTLIYVPASNPQLVGISTPNLDAILSEWGMQVNDGYVYETNTHYIWGSSMLDYIVEYTDYYFDTLKTRNVPVAVSYAHGVTIKDTTSAHAILQTSDKAGIYPADADQSFNYEDSVTGEAIPIAAEGTKSGTEDTSHVIAFSSSSMFDSQMLNYPSFNNATFFMNMVNTIADREDSTIVIASKSLQSPTMGAPTVATQKTIMIIFVFALPASILLVAIILWIRRRNR